MNRIYSGCYLLWSLLIWYLRLYRYKLLASFCLSITHNGGSIHENNTVFISCGFIGPTHTHLISSFCLLVKFIDIPPTSHHHILMTTIYNVLFTAWNSLFSIFLFCPFLEFTLFHLFHIPHFSLTKCFPTCGTCTTSGTQEPSKLYASTFEL